MNSYQITLLTGAVDQAAERLHIITSIYLVSSVIWWTVFRTWKSIYVLSAPFVTYGLAFLFIGLAPYGSTEFARRWVQNVATAFYAMASASGAFFFALNFGIEGQSHFPPQVWPSSLIPLQAASQQQPGPSAPA